MKALRESYWIKSGLFSSFERASIMGFGFLTFFLLVRSLEKETMGVWVLFTMVTAIVDQVRNGFIRNPLIKLFITASKQEQKIVESASLLLNVLLSITIAGLLYMGAGGLSSIWKAPALPQLFQIYIGTSLAMVCFSHLEAMQHVHMSFKGASFSHFVQKGTFFIYVLYCFLGKETIELSTLAYAQLVSIVLGSLVSWLFAHPYLSYSFRVQSTWLKQLFHYGKYTFGTNIGSMFMRNIDGWMLGGLLSPAAVPIYNTAIRITNLFEVPTTSLANVAFPKAVEKIKQEGLSAAKTMYEKSVGYILAMVLPFVLISSLFAKQIILLTAGREYLEAVPILQVTLFTGLVIPFNRQFGVILDAIGKARVNMLFVLGDALVNTALNYYLIGQWGILGAALATLSTFTLSWMIRQVYLQKYLKINILNCMRYGRECYRFALKLLQQKTLAAK
ncbi:flippase [Rapidithrix thailandica]|uniref:Flippase n=1 Tax=Rapidithrix thailandica TaxID=413964 RepID=A0AAW9SEX2_9BACT